MTSVLAPVEKTLTLSCTADHAFMVYTERVSDWWPVKDYSITGEAAKVKIEGRVGGRILEVDLLGNEHVWGEIDVWEPTERMAHTWHPGDDPAQATRVEISFVSDSKGGCTVTLVHSGWGSRTDGAEARVGYDSGWDKVLDLFVESAYRA